MTAIYAIVRIARQIGRWLLGPPVNVVSDAWLKEQRRAATLRGHDGPAWKWPYKTDV